MSKPMTRVVLSILISLGVIVAIYTSVQAGQERALDSSSANTHLVSGAMVNLNHDRLTVSELATYKAQLDSLKNQGTGHGGCSHDLQVNPDD